MYLGLTAGMNQKDLKGLISIKVPNVLLLKYYKTQKHVAKRIGFAKSRRGLKALFRVSLSFPMTYYDDFYFDKSFDKT